MNVRYSILPVGLAILLVSMTLQAANAWMQHGFGVKQYDEFHEVLHPWNMRRSRKVISARIRAQSIN